ncbi:MAG: hypothetical protein K1X89_20070 [Myxococcaceae bacterium]|nr:hypothetical protein [Myxococcaceae bacterium]
MSGSQYSWNRRVDAIKPANRVRADDVTVKDDLKVRGKFQKAMERAADALKYENERREHRTFRDAETRLGPTKK